MRSQNLLHSSKTLVGSLALSIGLAGAAHAATVTVDGILDGTDSAMPVVTISSPNCTSQGATLVHYDALPFTVDTSGTYSFSMLSTTGLASLYLHTAAFDPTAGLASCLAADNSGNPKGFDFDLTAGTNYFAVPFDDSLSQAGAAYSLTISGPGNIVFAAVPEPASLLLVGSALLTLVGFRRPRQALAA